MPVIWPDGWRRTIRGLRYFGWVRHCPLCVSHVRLFFPHGVVPRPNAVCPVCHSRDRHRLAWLWLRENTPILSKPLDMLHVAPEPVVARRLRALPKLRYVSGDIVHRADVRMDICRMPFGSSVFDLVYCSHVLNMLPRDGPALAELFRVLRPGGLALLQVPAAKAGDGVGAGAASTVEDRRRLLGDPDMYRRYGGDELALRLRGVGFDAQVVHHARAFSDRDRLRMGLIDEPLHVATKPVNA